MKSKKKRGGLPNLVHIRTSFSTRITLQFIPFCSPKIRPSNHLIDILVITIAESLQKCVSNHFLGAVCDTDAQRTVFGIQQAYRYCNDYKNLSRFAPTNSAFIFGGRSCESMGVTIFILPTPFHSMPEAAHVIIFRVPLLPGLGTLDLHGWTFLSVRNRLNIVNKDWSLALHRQYRPNFLRRPRTPHDSFSRKEIN